MAKGAVGNREVTVYDHVWVLFDTDVPARQGKLAPALALANKEGIHVGHSTPSVELWLLLHFRDRPGPLLNSNAAEHAVGEVWGQKYEKTKQAFPKLWDALKANVPVAVKRGASVREYHKKADSPSPANPSTELDLLVRALDASVQPQLRILG
ncbi:MAG TPA: RloB family protein [Clostridia bacterium]|nr:RloB family protein [Clostridia bacterium]